MISSNRKRPKRSWPKLRTVRNVEVGEKKKRAPALYNLLALQKDANSILGLTAEKTLKIAQSLYEKHKIITYPRTESQHLSTDMVDGLPNVIKALPGMSYDEHKETALARISEGLELGKSYVDDTKLTDHHAIIPTDKTANLDALQQNERIVYFMVCERFLSIFLPAFEIEETKADIDISGQIFRAKGVAKRISGWKALLTVKRSEQHAEKLPAMSKGDVFIVEKLTGEQKETKPPARYNDSTLLSAMKSAGKLVDDKEAAALMKETGLGTPATRAAIIERLISTGYMDRQKKTIVPTKKGMELIDQVQEQLKSPALTGEWEQKVDDPTPRGRL